MFILLASLAAGQQFTCDNRLDANLPTFNLCVSNAITDPLSSRPAGNDPTVPCQYFRDDQVAYNQCICRMSRLAATCYDNSCPNSSNRAANTGYAAQICSEAQVSTTQVTVTMSALPVGSSRTAATTSKASNTGFPVSGLTSGSGSLAIGSTIILGLLALV